MVRIQPSSSCLLDGIDFEHGASSATELTGCLTMRRANRALVQWVELDSGPIRLHC